MPFTYRSNNHVVFRSDMNLLQPINIEALVFSANNRERSQTNNRRYVQQQHTQPAFVTIPVQRQVTENMRRNSPQRSPPPPRALQRWQDDSDVPNGGLIGSIENNGHQRPLQRWHDDTVYRNQERQRTRSFENNGNQWRPQNYQRQQQQYRNNNRNFFEFTRRHHPPPIPNANFVRNRQGRWVFRRNNIPFSTPPVEDRSSRYHYQEPYEQFVARNEALAAHQRQQQLSSQSSVDSLESQFSSLSTVDTDTDTGGATSESKSSDDDQTRKRCVVCLDAEPNVVVLNCRHMKTCAKCIERVKQENNKCPVCRQTIDQILKVFV